MNCPQMNANERKLIRTNFMQGRVYEMTVSQFNIFRLFSRSPVIPILLFLFAFICGLKTSRSASHEQY
jgi:hypothetical protein